MDSANRWQPILPEPLAQQTLDLAEEIARALDEFPGARMRRFNSRISLSGGLPGRALFFAYLERCRPGQGWGDRAVELLEQALDELTGLPVVDHGLYSGFMGLAWVLEHVHGWLVDEDEDPGEEIARAVSRALSGSTPGQWGFDLVSGLAGAGVYALERAPRPGARECLDGVVRLLAATAERQGGIAVWKSAPEDTPPDRPDLAQQGCYYTGVAHGAAGVISLLAQAHAAGTEARPLLDEAVAALLAWKLPPGSGSVYGYEEVSPGAGSGKPTRLAWCHGDPGIAAALTTAARHAGEPAWEREAVDLARAAALRREEKRLVDAGLCHGTLGAAHLFNRMFQATGEPFLADAARFWLGRTLELRRSGEGIAGFLSWEIDETLEVGWRAEPGFLTGAAGAGLALLAAATPVEPAWDRLLLVSVPLRETVSI